MTQKGCDVLVEFDQEAAWHQVFHDCGEGGDCSAGEGLNDQLRRVRCGQPLPDVRDQPSFAPGYRRGLRCGT